MRADIHLLLNKLKLLYTNKLNLLKKFIHTNNASISFLKSNNLHALEDSIVDDTSIIAKIDLIDFEITEVKNSLCKKSGIQHNEFQEYFIDSSDSSIEIELKSIILEIKNLLKEVHIGREAIIEQLEQHMSELKKEILSINSLNKTKKNIPIIH